MERCDGHVGGVQGRGEVTAISILSVSLRKYISIFLSFSKLLLESPTNHVDLRNSKLFTKPCKSLPVVVACLFKNVHEIPI